MDLDWFEDFIFLVEAGTFSKAAERRDLSQPAFSRRIAALEAWAGTSLLVRGAHRIALTPAGDRFRQLSEETLRRIHLAHADIQEIGRTSASALQFATTFALSLTYFAPWLKSLETDSSVQATIRLVVDTMTACEKTLVQGQTQFVMCHHHDLITTPLDTAQFQWISLGQDPLVPLSAPTADGNPIFKLPGTPKRPVKFLAYTRESGLARILNGVRQALGPSAVLDQVFASHASTTLAAMARDARGVAWVPRSFAIEDLEKGRLVPAGGDKWDIATEIRLIRPKVRQSPSAEQLWRTAVARHGSGG